MKPPLPCYKSRRANMVSRLGILLPLLLVAGCAAKKPIPPAERTLQLAGLSANYRDWRGRSVCDVDPKSLAADLDSMRPLLAEFLGETSAGFDGMWGDEHVAVLEQAVAKLPPALDGTEAVLQGGPACPGFEAPSGVDELARQARKRLAEAPYLLPYVKARRELLAFRNTQPKLEAEAKEKTCASARKGSKPVIFYAEQDETGDFRFLFCDGATVTRVAESEAVAQPSKKLTAQDYFAATHTLPKTQITNAPRLPPKGPEVKEDKFDLNAETP